jgi:hypothetical protein
MAGLTTLTLVLALVDLEHLARWFWILLVAMVTLSATQDIAIDAYTIEATRPGAGVWLGPHRLVPHRDVRRGRRADMARGPSRWTPRSAPAPPRAPLAVAALALPRVSASASHGVALGATARAGAQGNLAHRRLRPALLLDIAALDPMTRPFAGFAVSPRRDRRGAHDQAHADDSGGRRRLGDDEVGNVPRSGRSAWCNSSGLAYAGRVRTNRSRS